MPTLSISELNTVISVLGAFIALYGIISVKIKQTWYLGEALPAVAIGVILGPIAARFLDSEKWGSAEPGQTNAITLGLMRVMIGVQLVIVGFQLPDKYVYKRWKEMAMCLLPVMTLMWLCTTACVLAAVPKVTLLSALVIGSCVTCTDPILSQAVAKGPFADKFVARPLREIISSEAGANDGFGFPFLMLATYLMRYGVYDGVGEGGFAEGHGAEGAEDAAHRLLARSGGADEVARQGGGPGEAIKYWFLETWLYVILLSVVYGAVIGYGSSIAIKFALRKRWVDGESYLLFPVALGLFILGTCGSIGSDDLLACFVAGCALNWSGEFLSETERRHDEVNSCVDVLLNFGGFMYIGTIMPWSEFHDPDGTGLTIGRLMGLGFLVLIFRRMPSILLTYKLMPKVVADYKEALFMGYFGPIGAGAVFYLEHTRHLFPELGEGDAEQTNLVRVMGPVVYWLVLFSIVVHGLSIPALNLIYKYKGVKPIKDDAVEIRRASVSSAAPSNAVVGGEDRFVAYNRFSRPTQESIGLPLSRSMSRSFSQSMGQPLAPFPRVSQSTPPDGNEEKNLAQRRTIRYVE